MATRQEPETCRQCGERMPPDRFKPCANGRRKGTLVTACRARPPVTLDEVRSEFSNAKGEA